ncbi:MAG: LysR family transcriptional regulator [Burkholderiales bacterium]|nr:LysR family transcriptional regulator [Burkholderiales bacterium]
MELRDLRLFLDVAATGSFSRAAALNDSTQSAVSKRIGALESGLGATLFLRTGRGAALTDAGRALLPRAESLTMEAAGLADLVGQASAAPRGLVRLALQPSVGWPLTGDLVTATRQRHPGVRLQIAEGTTRQIEEWLAEGRVDLGLLSNVPAPAHARGQALFALPLILVTRAGAAATARRTVSFTRVAAMPQVIAAAPNGGRLLIEEAARRMGLTLNIVLEVNSIHLIKKIVAQGELASVITAPAVAAEVAAGELAVSRIVRPEIRQTFYLAVGGRRHPGPAVRVVADLVRQLAPALAGAAQ